MNSFLKNFSLFRTQGSPTKKVFSYSKKIFFVLLAIILYYGCTDVPLSYSTKVLDSDIIGYWQETDSTALHIYTSSAGVAYSEYLKFDKVKRRYVKDGTELNKKIYFTKIGTGGSSRYFLSQQYSDKVKDGYVNAKFIATSTRLSIFPLSDSYLDKYKKTKDGKHNFGSSRTFRDFVTRHYKNSGFFGKTISYTRRKYKSDLVIPRYKKPRAPSSPSTSTKNTLYDVEQARIRTYIPELETWDDYTEWTKLDKNSSSIKFFSKGVRISLEITKGTKYEFFASDLKYKEKQRIDANTIWYLYEGVAKKDNKVIGNLRLDLLGANYNEFKSGIKGKIIRADLRWDDKKVSGSKGSVQQLGFLMRYKK